MRRPAADFGGPTRRRAARAAGPAPALSLSFGWPGPRAPAQAQLAACQSGHPEGIADAAGPRLPRSRLSGSRPPRPGRSLRSRRMRSASPTPDPATTHPGPAPARMPGTTGQASTTSDVFNAIAEAHRREILDALMAGEKAVGAIVDDLSMSQPQVSKHLRVLSEVGLVRCRAEGRRRLYRLEPARLRPLHEWLAKYEQAWNDRLDQVDDYLKELQQQSYNNKESGSDT